jgi:NADP-dependent 3-hydroxy acid dehydrogenase YdfG
MSKLEAEITSSGGTAATFPVNLTDSTALTSTFASITERFPGSPVKLVIFNLNTTWAVKPFSQLEENLFKGVVSDQISAAFNLSQLALKEFEKTNGGTLIFTGNGFSVKGNAMVAALSSASFAVRGLR